MMEFLQRFDQQVIDRKPHRPAPVGIAAKQPRRRFRRFIINAMLVAAHLQNIRIVFVITRKGADSVRRKKLVFVEHHFQNTLQSFTKSDCKKMFFTVIFDIHT